MYICLRRFEFTVRYNPGNFIPIYAIDVPVNSLEGGMVIRKVCSHAQPADFLHCLVCVAVLVLVLIREFYFLEKVRDIEGSMCAVWQ